jgi:acyl dehydratase
VKFAEFRPGQVLEAGSVSLSEDDIVAFARAWDPQWFHVDPLAASQGRFGGLIASGWQTCGVAMRLAVEHFLDGSESFASPAT